MREDGLVRSLRGEGEEPDARRRQYWQATAVGRDVLAAEIERLEAVVAAGKRRVAGGGAASA
jgi:DNA-binding PadR family transcriptional regulator